MVQVTMRRALALLILVLPLLATAAGAASPPSLAGHWEGILIIQPAVSELEMSFEFLPAADGGWSGKLSLPGRTVHGYPLDFVKLEGSTLSFAYTYSAGTSRFRGILADDGTSITGKLIEDGQEHPFVLKRAAAAPEPTKPVPVRTIESAAELRALFDAHAGKVRLVLLLSPT